MQRRFLMPFTLFLGLFIPLLLGLLAPFDKKPAVGQAPAETQSVCPSADQALIGVWSPSRLGMLNSCQQASGTVMMAEHELDGDLDLYVDLDPEYDQLAGSATGLGYLHKWGPGDVIVELMPRDGEHLPGPSEGDHIDLTGAWVTDNNHGYNEIHPVWSESINEGDASMSGPANGGSPPQSTAQTAAADCKDGSGNPCAGY